MTLKTKLLGAFASLALLAGGSYIAAQTGENTAQAQSQSAKTVVDGAIARGAIGETSGGYLDGTGTENAAERNAMNEINIGRKALYTRKARDENISVEVVAAIFGEKQIAKARPGAMVKEASGWRKK